MRIKIILLCASAVALAGSLLIASSASDAAFTSLCTCVGSITPPFRGIVALTTVSGKR